MKKKKILKYLFPLIFIFTVICVGSISIFISVKRQKDIHYISSEAGLKSINNDLSGHYIIDSPDSITLSKNWQPIGDREHPFTGILDCNYVTIYISGFDSSYVAQGANQGEVLLGLFSVNKGTIKHLGLSYSKTNLSESIETDKEYDVICGSACAINYGYVSMCFVNSSPNIETTPSCGQIIFGGVAGINYKQVRCCSVSNSINIKAQSSKITCGGLCGICGNDSIVEYCIRNGFLWVNSTTSEDIICGQCIGRSKGGLVDNVSVTSKDMSSYKTYSYIDSPSISIGGLIGEVDCDNLNINRININTSFEMRHCEKCEFGFLIGKIQNCLSSVIVKDIVLTGKFENGYQEGFSCGYLYSSQNNGKFESESIYAYDVNSSIYLKQKDLISEMNFVSISLQMLDFDAACWKKGQYSFILDIEKLK